ncbi:MAG: hypothetical protein KC983_12760, partial [Phycisphaerales bacterium]|nr:hypothetical protein [Phycisphaerales bacterium]
MARTGKSTKAKTAPAKSARRRAELRRNLGRPAFSLRTLIDRPDLLNAVAALLVFVIAATMLMNWSREQPRVRDGQIMTNTRLKRLDYAVVDVDATEKQRAEARASAPRIYRTNTTYLDLLHESLRGLPTALANRTSLDDVDPVVRRDYPHLNEETLAVLSAIGSDNVQVSNWYLWVDNLINLQLIETPLILSSEYQVFVTHNRRLARVQPDGSTKDEMILGIPIELKDPPSADAVARLRQIVVKSNVPPPLVEFMIRKLLYDQKASLVFDAERTEATAREFADMVQPVTIEHHAGELLYRRGDVLTPAQYQDLMTERDKYQA